MESATMEEALLEFTLILILVNGFFAAAEISLVSSSVSRLQAMVAADHSGARRVLAPREDSQHTGRTEETASGFPNPQTGGCQE